MTHPVLQGMLMTGCRKQQNILLAFHTYMELSEVKVLWDIDYGYEKDIDIIYIKAKSSKNAEFYDYYVPISTSFSVSFDWIVRVQNKILNNERYSSFILVIKERDSASVYYKISEGLVPPLSPEAAKRKKSVEEKRKYLETELKKRKSQLFNEAKNSLLAVPRSSEIVTNSAINTTTTTTTTTSTTGADVAASSFSSSTSVKTSSINTSVTSSTASTSTAVFSVTDKNINSNKNNSNLRSKNTFKRTNIITEEIILEDNDNDNLIEIIEL